MTKQARIAFLRGSATIAGDASHPILELSEDDLRRAIGGVDNAMASSTMTATYGNTYDYCCDPWGSVCCCIIKT